MPVTSTQINTYGVSVISYEDPNQMVATVSLFDAGGNVIALLRFYSADSSPAPNEFRSDLGHPLVSYPLIALAPMVDLLRNEKPLYFIWHDYMPERCIGVVETSREPAGESETV
jgi:hypothetical protein